MSAQPRQRQRSMLKDSFTNSAPRGFDRSKLLRTSCNSNVSIYRPSQTKGVYIVRPFPARDESPGTFQPYRYSTDEFDMSDWIRLATTANYVGLDKRETFVLFDPREQGYDLSTNPYQILQSKIFFAKKSGDSRLNLSDLNRLLESKTDTPFSRPARSAFFFGALYQSSSKDIYVAPGKPAKGLGPEDHAILTHISGTAVDNLFKLLNERTPEYSTVVSEDSKIIQKAMAVGNPVNIKSGRFIVFCDPDEELAVLPDGVQQRPSPPRMANALAKPYHVEVLPELRLRGVRKPSLEGFEAVVWQRSLPFDEVLHFPSHDEICYILAQLYQSKVEWLEYAWADHPEFFTSEVNGVLRGRVSSTSAGKTATTISADELEEDDDEEPGTTTAVEEEAEEETTAPFVGDLDDDEDDMAAAKGTRKAAAHPEEEEDDEEALDELEDLEPEDLEEEEVPAPKKAPAGKATAAVKAKTTSRRK